MTSPRATAPARLLLAACCALLAQTLGCDVGNSILVPLQDASTNDLTLDLPIGADVPADGSPGDGPAADVTPPPSTRRTHPTLSSPTDPPPTRRPTSRRRATRPSPRTLPSRRMSQP